MTRQRHALEIPLQLLLHYQSATRPTTMCSVHRHVPTTHAGVTGYQPATTGAPGFQLCPENWLKSLVNISSVNPAQIPPIWPLPLFPASFPLIHSEYTLSPHLFFFFFGWSHFTHWILFLCVFFLYSFPLASLWWQQAETCVWGLHKYYAYTWDNVTARMWPSCVKFESARCVYRYVSVSVIRRTHRDCWLVITHKPLQTTAFYSTSTRTGYVLNNYDTIP